MKKFPPAFLVFCALPYLIPISASSAGLPDSLHVDQLPVNPELPDPFLNPDGSRINTVSGWEAHREDLKEMFRHYEYGHAPPSPGNIIANETSSQSILNGTVTRKELRLTFGPGQSAAFRVILYIPAGLPGPFPAIVNDFPVDGGPSLPEIIKRGYLLAEFYCVDLAPDTAGRAQGVFPLYPGYDWGVLAVWAWGYSRTLDYLLTLDMVDPRRIIATGLSRGGKAALLAGALDERFALVNPDASGAAGSSPFRFTGRGVLDSIEDLPRITSHHGHWFNSSLAQFAGKETHLPFDQHELRALVAPRPLLITDSKDDLWANPKGDQFTHLASREVYRFLGAEDKIGIHYRLGPHGQTAEDWIALLDFADRNLRNLPVTQAFDSLPYPTSEKAFSWSAPQAVSALFSHRRARPGVTESGNGLLWDGRNLLFPRPREGSARKPAGYLGTGVISLFP